MSANPPPPGPPPGGPGTQWNVGSAAPANDAYLGNTITNNYYNQPLTTGSLPPTARYSIPAPPGDFVGRAGEIAALEAELRRAAEGGAIAAISGIRGMGGLGKTALAQAVAARLVDAFPDARILLALRGASSSPQTPEAALGAVIHAFAPHAPLPADRDELRALYLGVLAGKRVLILADDAAGPEQVRLLIPPSGCALLITSRQDFRLPGLRPYRLDALPPAEAVALVREICPRLIETDAATLAEHCGGLPLALRAAASLLAVDAHRPVAGYLAGLADQRQRLILLKGADDPDLDVEASLALSWAGLPAAAQTVLAQFSVFPASFDLAAALAVVALDEPHRGNAEVRRTEEGQTPEDMKHVTRDTQQIEDLLGLLCRRSLLDYDEASERYRLHDLVRAFAAGRLLAPAAPAARWRHARHYATVLRQVSAQYQQGGDALMASLARFDRERAQIDAGWTWARTQAAAVPTQADPLLIDYTDAAAFLWDLRFDTRRERIPWLEGALTAARRQGRLGAEGAFLGNLGLAYAALGEPRRTIEFYEQQLAITRAIGDHRSEGATLGNLGLAYADLGEPHRAIEYYEQHLALARATGDRRREGNALGNLGNAYADLGEPHRAIELFEQELVIRQGIGDRRGEGAALGSLGNTYSNLGERERAIKYYEQALVIAHLIGDRQNEATHSWNLGDELAKLGDLARAVELMQICVDYEQAVGRPTADWDAARLEQVRRRLAEREKG